VRKASDILEELVGEGNWGVRENSRKGPREKGAVGNVFVCVKKKKGESNTQSNNIFEEDTNSGQHTLMGGETWGKNGEGGGEE